jgi:hypothetical protein
MERSSRISSAGISLSLPPPPSPHGLPLSPPAPRPPFPPVHPPALSLSLCTYLSTLADIQNTLAWRAGMATAPVARCWRQLGARQCTTTDDQRRLRSRRAPGLGPVTHLRKNGATGCTKVSRVVFLCVAHVQVHVYQWTRAECCSGGCTFSHLFLI